MLFKQCPPSNVLQQCPLQTSLARRRENRQRRSLPNIPHCLGGMIENTRRAGCSCHKSHVTVGFHPRACHPSQSHATCLTRVGIWASLRDANGAGPGMGAYTLPALAGERRRDSESARFTHGHWMGRDTLAAGQRRGPEKSWGGNAGLGTTREQQPAWRKEAHWYWEAVGKPARLLVRFFCQILYLICQSGCYFFTSHFMTWYKN